jgi:lysophospholipid acyltransferase (LPLAT)-like uncharacterized protein
VPRFRTRYAVDEVPGWWQPPFWIYSYAAAGALFLYFRLVRLTSRVTLRGGQQLEREEPYVFACWHDQFPLYLGAQPRHPGEAWMVLPSWYMKPMHLLARWSGVEELVHGASGHHGGALKRLVEKLAAGRSTVFLPDGPFDRPRQAHTGILYMSRDSGRAIVPIRMSASPVVRLNSWDRKIVPLPFSRIEVDYGPPIRVAEVSSEALADLTAALNDEPPA